jgi:signal transduction histidine kinase
MKSLESVRRFRASPRLARYAVAVSLSLVAIVLTAVLDETLPGTPSVLVFAVVLVIAWVAGLGPAIAAALLGGSSLAYFRELVGWHSTAREALWMLVFFATVLAMASLTAWIRQLEDERAELLVREREARAQAEAANSAKDEFLAVVSHEMKTPLTAILTWIEVIRRHGALPAELLNVADTIARNARLQAKLVDDLLDVSRAAAGKLAVSLTEVDVSEVVRHVARSYRPRAEKAGVALTVAIQPGVRVVADAQRLEQVVGNLVSNAVKFTPSGGLATLSLVQELGQARITVADSGQGIDPSHLEHVFERFWQDAAPIGRREGLGLGLAIVKHIVEEHGGRVHAQSAGRGRGATFVVELPVAERAAA